MKSCTTRITVSALAGSAEPAGGPGCDEQPATIPRANTTRPTRRTIGMTAQALPSAECVAAGERLTEYELVHLGCALIGQHRFQVDHVPNNRVLQRYPVAAQYRSGGSADLDRLTSVVQFTEADLLRAQPCAVLEAAQMQRQQLALVQFDRHVDEFCLGQLESGD